MGYLSEFGRHMTNGMGVYKGSPKTLGALGHAPLVGMRFFRTCVTYRIWSLERCGGTSGSIKLGSLDFRLSLGHV